MTNEEDNKLFADKVELTPTVEEKENQIFAAEFKNPPCTERGVKIAFVKVLAKCNNDVARVYAEAGLSLTGEALRVQCLYVLNNTQYWRGNDAIVVKDLLKEFAKGGK